MVELPQLTTEMILVMLLLAFAVFLFATEIIRVDVAAILIMTLLGVLIFVPSLEGMVSPSLLFSGFSSNAVVSIIAVMIIGAGLDKTGVMGRFAETVMKIGGRSEKKMVSLVSSTVGVTSSFMQNVGATALFLPMVSHISARTGIALSRLLMPMGFCAILGGTMTMVGSSPLIMLNDLINNANRSLPADQAMETFDLFSVAPVGLALLAAGLVYFIVFGRFVLPSIESGTKAIWGAGAVEYLERIYHLHATVNEVAVSPGSPFVGQEIVALQRKYEVRIIASHYAGKSVVCPPVEAPIAAPALLAVIGQPENVKQFVADGDLNVRPQLVEFEHTLANTEAGIAEIVVPPDSPVIDKSVRDLRFRATYGLSILSIHRAGETISDKLQDVPFQTGDTIVCYTTWENLARLEQTRDFVVITSEYPHREQRPHKVLPALTFFVLALSLVIFTDMLLPVALLTGAVGMIISGVLTMDEAYNAVSWKTVFILAGLLPLGHAVESTGTANWIAQHMIAVLGDVPAWTLQLAVAVLAAGFTLVMSNVGATVLLVPIAVNLALVVGASPAMFALTVAISTSNSFLIPTHQVNALIMGPGGYSVADFVKAGGIMTVLFLVVSLLALNAVF